MKTLRPFALFLLPFALALFCGCATARTSEAGTIQLPPVEYVR